MVAAPAGLEPATCSHAGQRTPAASFQLPKSYSVKKNVGGVPQQNRRLTVTASIMRVKSLARAKLVFRRFRDDGPNLDFAADPRRYPSLAGLSRLLELESEPAFGINQSVARGRVIKEPAINSRSAELNGRFGSSRSQCPRSDSSPSCRTRRQSVEASTGIPVQANAGLVAVDPYSSGWNSMHDPTGSGATRASRSKRANCSLRSTVGSLKGLIPAI